MKNPETLIQNDILKALREHPKVGFIGRNTRGKFKTMWGGFVWAGLINGAPDLVGHLSTGGVLLGIEAKTPKGSLTRDQVLWLANAQRCGCCVGVAMSVEDAVAIVEGRLVQCFGPLDKSQR